MEEAATKAGVGGTTGYEQTNYQYPYYSNYYSENEQPRYEEPYYSYDYNQQQYEEQLQKQQEQFQYLSYDQHSSQQATYNSGYIEPPYSESVSYEELYYQNKYYSQQAGNQGTYDQYQASTEVLKENPKDTPSSPKKPPTAASSKSGAQPPRKAQKKTTIYERHKLRQQAASKGPPSDAGTNSSVRTGTRGSGSSAATAAATPHLRPPPNAPAPAAPAAPAAADLKNAKGTARGRVRSAARSCASESSVDETTLAIRKAMEAPDADIESTNESPRDYLLSISQLKEKIAQEHPGNAPSPGKLHEVELEKAIEQEQNPDLRNEMLKERNSFERDRIIKRNDSHIESGFKGISEDCKTFLDFMENVQMQRMKHLSDESEPEPTFKEKHILGNVGGSSVLVRESFQKPGLTSTFYLTESSSSEENTSSSGSSGTSSSSSSGGRSNNLRGSKSLKTFVGKPKVLQRSRNVKARKMIIPKRECLLRRGRSQKVDLEITGIQKGQIGAKKSTSKEQRGKAKTKKQRRKRGILEKPLWRNPRVVTPETMLKVPDRCPLPRKLQPGPSRTVFTQPPPSIKMTALARARSLLVQQRLARERLVAKEWTKLREGPGCDVTPMASERLGSRQSADSWATHVSGNRGRRELLPPLMDDWALDRMAQRFRAPRSRGTCSLRSGADVDLDSATAPTAPTATAPTATAASPRRRTRRSGKHKKEKKKQPLLKLRGSGGGGGGGGGGGDRAAGDATMARGLDLPESRGSRRSITLSSSCSLPWSPSSPLLLVASPLSSPPPPPSPSPPSRGARRRLPPMTPRTPRTPLLPPYYECGPAVHPVLPPPRKRSLPPIRSPPRRPRISLG